MLYWRSLKRQLLLTWRRNINGLFIPPSSPHRFHEKKLHIFKNIEITFIYVTKYLIFIFIKYLFIMTKRSNLSYYWIRDTSIIGRFFHFPNVSYWWGRLVPYWPTYLYAYLSSYWSTSLYPCWQVLVGNTLGTILICYLLWVFLITVCTCNQYVCALPQVHFMFFFWFTHEYIFSPTKSTPWQSQKGCRY